MGVGERNLIRPICEATVPLKTHCNASDASDLPYYGMQSSAIYDSRNKIAKYVILKNLDLIGDEMSVWLVPLLVN